MRTRHSNRFKAARACDNMSPLLRHLIDAGSTATTIRQDEYDHIHDALLAREHRCYNGWRINAYGTITYTATLAKKGQKVIVLNRMGGEREKG